MPEVRQVQQAEGQDAGTAELLRCAGWDTHPARCCWDTGSPPTPPTNASQRVRLADRQVLLPPGSCALSRAAQPAAAAGTGWLLQQLQTAAARTGAAAINDQPLARIEVHGKQLFYMFGDDPATQTVVQVSLVRASAWVPG